MALTGWEQLMVVVTIVVFLTVVVSGVLLYLHLKHYTQPRHQRCIVRLIFMVPLYAIYSLLCLVRPPVHPCNPPHCVPAVSYRGFADTTHRRQTVLSRGPEVSGRVPGLLRRFEKK
jgi:Organic solute transporter Ostalpha